MHLGLGLSLRDQRGSGGASVIPWEIITPKADRTMSINDTVVPQSTVLGVGVGSSIKIPPNATQAHIKLTFSEVATTTAYVYAVEKTSNAIGFNGVSDITAPTGYFYWRPGDDADLWITIDIDTPRANDGDRFQINFSGEGWNSTIGALVEIQTGAVNELPAQMPAHRNPKEWLSNSATPTKTLDISTMEITDTGFASNAVSGTPCWKSHPSHGYSNFSSNGETGVYMGAYSYPNDEINPHTIEQDLSGRDVLRLSSRKLPVPVTINTTDFPHQASMIQGQTMADWSYRRGVYRALIQTPSRQGAWSAFWGVGRNSSGGNMWPPEIDFFESFNSAFGASYTEFSTSSGQHVGVHASNTRQQVNGLATELDEAGFNGSMNLNTGIHEYVCVIQDDFIYHFVDGIETLCHRNMCDPEDGSTDWSFYPVINVAVKRTDTAAYNDGTGDLLLYGLEYYALDDGWTLGDFATARPYPDRKVTPDPSFTSDTWNNVSGIQLFLDGSEANTIKNSSGDVYTWAGRDVSSNAAYQTVSGERPVTGTRTINSVNALDFDAANDEHFDLLNPIDTSSGVSGVVIFNLDSGGTNRPLIGSVGTGGFTLRTNSSRQLQIVRTSESVLLTGSTALSTGTDYIVGFRATDTSLDLYINGGTADATSTTNPAFTADSEYIGQSITTNWDGAIGLVAVYSGHLSDADLNTVGNAAASEYGLTWTDI